MTDQQLFLRHLAQTSDSPMMVEPERAEGIYVYDTHGKKYFDLISGINVSNIGHRHPKVIAAIEAQLKKYMHVMVYGEYVQSPQIQYAKLLTDHLPSQLDCVYFTNSGTEATEGALKLAKRFTGRTEIVSFQNSYHGSTQGALSVMGDEDFRNAFRPLIPGNRLLNFNNENDLNEITIETAAVILEPIQAEAGVILPEKNFLKQVRQRCDEVGALMILDECQTAFGRTGTLFCFEQYGFVPDILLLAKALGGGMPLGAFISSKEKMSALSNNPVLGHITTFGGHPVCCAAGNAAMEVLLEEKWIVHVQKKSQQLVLALRHEKIKTVRAAGLLIAVELESESVCKKAIALCISKSVITDWFLFAPNCLRIAPPLIISEREIEEATSIIVHSIRQTVSE